MPLYEYQCAACGERTEILQKVSDPFTSQCPKCGAEMKRMISSPAIQFKGSGFYKTDYAAKPPPSSSESKGETKSESKTESKPETKSETKSD